MTTIRQTVIDWLSSKKDTDYALIQILKDLQQSGCSSGMVDHLISHSDCVKFCSDHWNEIQDIVNDMYENTGETDFLFDKSSGFSFSRIAWLVFEHVAFQIYTELEESEVA